MTRPPANRSPVIIRRSSARFRVLALLGLAWTVIVGLNRDGENTGSDRASEVAAEAVAPLAHPSAAPRPVLRSGEGATTLGLAAVGPSSSEPAEPTVRRSAPQRSEPRPTFFSRFSYRTTGPPLRRG